MAWDINRVVLVGRLANDIEMKSSRDGMSIAKFGLAVGGKPNPDGSDSVSFFDVTTFGKTADNCARFLKKGSQVAVEGRLQQDRWQAQDGSRRSRVIIVGDRVEFLGSSGQGGGGGSRPQERREAPGAGADSFGGGYGGGDEMYDNSNYDNTFDSTPLDSGNDDFAPF